MRSFIVWTRPRTAGTTLGRALGAENEPFRRGANSGRFADVHDACERGFGREPLERFCAAGISLKHITTGFPTAFNIALAQTATAAGYRHIHLVRCDELARLVSFGVAAQHDAWLPGEAAAHFAELRAGRRRMKPLEVADLVGMSKNDMAAGRAIVPHLGRCLTVRSEDMVHCDCGRRRRTLRLILRHLEMPATHLRALDDAMRTGGQDTRAVWPMVPNIAELRQAMRAEGLA